MIYFFIWNHSRVQLMEFINLFNSHDKSINIDCNINETSIDFWMSQSSKILGFLTIIFWTLRYVLRKRTPICVKSIHKRLTSWLNKVMQNPSLMMRWTCEMGLCGIYLIITCWMTRNQTRYAWFFIAPQNTRISASIISAFKGPILTISW